MPLPPRPAPARAPRSAAGALGAVLALAVVCTAAAPGVVQLRPGDTLSEIAQRYGVTVEQLRAANGLSAGQPIYAGKTLRLPAGSGPTAGELAHVVQTGDTVSSIAARYGSTVQVVLQRNGLDARGLIHPGQQLLVATGVSAAPMAPAAPAPSVPAGRVSSSAAQHRDVLAGRKVPSKDQARAAVAAAARKYGVDPSLALAIAYQESGFQQRVVSGVDAIGVMQVLPSTAKGLEREAGRRLDLLDVDDNVTAGVLLLRKLIRSEGSEEAALAGYYQGIGSIQAKGVLQVTRDYIANINALRSRFRNG